MKRGRLAALLVLFAFACQKPPPKPPPAPPPPPPEAPPPPPPKCESLDEKCVSTADTRVAIQETGWTIAPPAGWTYAHASDATMVVSEKSAIVIEAVPVPNPKKPPRAQALASVVEKLAVKFPKRKAKLDLPRRADKTTAIASLKVAFYQLDGAVRDAKKGPLLVFAANLPEGSLLVGAGFVPDDDKSNADAAILKAVESLATTPPTTPQAKAPPAAEADASAPTPATTAP